MAHDSELTSIIASLQAHCIAADFRGFDPYDLRSHPLLISAQRHALTKYGVEVLISNWPDAARRALGVRPQQNAKALGLFVRAFCVDASDLPLARMLFDRLLAGRADHAHTSWGYPFPWQSDGCLYPENFPNAAATVQGGLACLALFERTQDEVYLEQARSVARFFTESLNRSTWRGHSWFSYTTSDHFQVLNISAQIAGFLHRLDSASVTTTHAELVSAVREGLLAAQGRDGSFLYRVDTLSSFIDNYHTAITLENLADIAGSDAATLDAVRRGLEYYKSALLWDDTAPLFRVGLRMPVDIHSCAHAILLLDRLRDAAAARVLRWTLDHMWTGHHFGYRVYSVPGVRPKNLKELVFRVLIPRARDDSDFMRWNQAWMLLALKKHAAAVNNAPAV